MDLPFTEKFPIMVEILEERQSGTRKVWFSKARRVYRKPDNVSFYKVKDIPQEIPAPALRHLEPMDKGELLRLYSPSPDQYFVMTTEEWETIQARIKEVEEEIPKKLGPISIGTKKIKKPILQDAEPIKSRKLKVIIDNEMLNWANWQMQKSHEDWKKPTFFDKWLPFIMLIVVGIIFIIGTKFMSDGMMKAAASADSAAAHFENQAALWNKAIEMEIKLYDRLDLFFDKYNITKPADVITNPPTPPPV
jgi:hypothetical protein